MKKLRKAVISLSMLAMPFTAFASDAYESAFSTGMQKSGMASLIKLMMNAFVFIGAAVVIFGAVQIAFAFRSDDAEGKTKGLRNAIAGVLVVAVGIAGPLVMNALNMY